MVLYKHKEEALTVNTSKSTILWRMEEYRDSVEKLCVLLTTLPCSLEAKKVVRGVARELVLSRLFRRVGKEHYEKLRQKLLGIEELKFLDY